MLRNAKDNPLDCKYDLSFSELLSHLKKGGIFDQTSVYKGTTEVLGESVKFALAQVKGTKYNFLLSIRAKENISQ